AMLSRLCELARERGSIEEENEVPRRDGTQMNIRIAVAPLRDARREVTGYVAVAADVTESRRNERARVELENSLRRAAAVSAMGALVAGVAHEVRNPLFAMTAHIDALEQSGKARPPELIASLRRELGRLNQLMNDLLEYGKPPSDELTEEPLAPIVALAVRTCAPAAQSAKVALENAMLPDPGMVAAQPARLAPVFQSLIDTAVQPSPAGSAGPIGAALPQPDLVEVRVLDRGPGFRSGDLPRIFEPFFSRRRGGTGLGLSIVQRIVEQHHGAV